MTLRSWEVVVAVIVLALAAIFFAGGDPAGGVALLALAIIGAASRARIVERPVAGSYARARGIIGVVVTATFFRGLRRGRCPVCDRCAQPLDA